MTVIELIQRTINGCHEIMQAYLSDLTDADLLVRPVPGSNHIAWAIGHLIESEREMMALLGYDMPELPAGFTAAHTKETASSDDPAKFFSKNEYVTLMEKVRAGTLAAVAATSEADLDKPAPERMQVFAEKVADVLVMIGMHELMHAGQFSPIRRKLGKPPLM